jgi:hypothetical protein
VEIRPPNEPDDEPFGEPEPHRGPAQGVGHGPDGSVFFRVRTGVIAGKFAAAAVLVVVALTAGRGFGLWLGLLAAALIAAYGLRDVLGRERLRADATGIRIGTGFSGHRDLPWSQVERVKIDQRLRLGIRTDMLEVDAGEELYLFSRYDLGAEPQDALDALLAVRPS